MILRECYAVITGSLYDGILQRKITCSAVDTRENGQPAYRDIIAEIV